MKSVDWDGLTLSYFRDSLAVLPTDTVPGLFCCEDSCSLDRLFESKARPESKPVALFLYSVSQIGNIVNITDEQLGLLHLILPGKFTIVMEVSPSFSCDSRLLSFDDKSGSYMVGFRVPNHERLLSALRSFGSRLVATSVNMSGDSRMFPEHRMPRRLEEAVGYIVKDRNHSGKGEGVGLVGVPNVGEMEPSTVVRWFGGELTVLRRGAGDLDLLSKVCKNIAF